MSLLRTHNLTAHYGDFQALFGVDIELNAGETIAIIGQWRGKNHAYALHFWCIAQCIRERTFEGSAIGAKESDAVMRDGIAMVPEGRKLFPSLSVKENLLIGTYGRKVKGYWTLEAIYDLFPILQEKADAPPRPYQGAAANGGDWTRLNIKPKVCYAMKSALALPLW